MTMTRTGRCQSGWGGVFAPATRGLGARSCRVSRSCGRPTSRPASHSERATAAMPTARARRVGSVQSRR
eukprot:3535296-Rhodomonas_salina.1